ncbi:oxidoreductase [Leekyejoonella antrihumi]|uniref:Oxidoreductase n=1 Tax=Leekyejoonella antrihumi TaxID=1660198 RepID=A0A563E0N4_9MICO|nr:oxidoreductase [Leekyejoonella antrihumi]
MSKKPPAPQPSEFRGELSHGEDHINKVTWAGSIGSEHAIAPRIRVGRDRWFNILWLIPIGFAVALIAVAVAQGLRTMPSIQHFIADFPGVPSPTQADEQPGMPWWVNLQHFVNILFMFFIIRSGWQILVDHPRLYWTRHSRPGNEWMRVRPKSPDDPLWTAKQDSVDLPKHVGLPGLRHTIGLARWWHFTVDIGWLVNGVVFFILIFATGQWQRLVPTSWRVFPDALSVMIQYLSLNFPANHGWVAYNGLQLLAYFITVFIAAPLALITGLGMSPALSTRFHRFSRVFHIQLARSIHSLVMMWFVFFIVVHVTMVFVTGARENLNAMFAARDSNGWLGVGIFGIGAVIILAAWFTASPFTLRHPRVVQNVGNAVAGPFQRWFEKVNLSPNQYTEADISDYFWHNGTWPESPEYARLMANGFEDYRLRIDGLVDNPMELSLADLHALPHHEQITQHYCIQGWSGVAKWGGVSMSTILAMAQPHADAKWVVFYSIAEGSDGGIYYDAHPIAQMRGELAMLAYEFNGEPLTYGHGAPLRLRNEVQLGFKQVKWIKGVEFVAHFDEIGGGYGGYNEDHEYYGYSQSI